MSRPTERPDPAAPTARGEFLAAPAWSRVMNRFRRRHALLLDQDALWDAGTPLEPGTPPARHDSFAQWCATHRGGHCDVWLSAMLVHELVCDPALPPSTDAALVRYARSVFVHYHGDAARDWPLAAWSSQGRQGVSALHGTDPGRMQADARAHDVRLHALRPWWSRALALMLRRSAELRSTPWSWLLMAEGRHVNVLGLHRGSLVEQNGHWLAEPDAAALGAIVRGLRTNPAVRRAEAPIVAIGHGLSGGPPPEIQCLGRLDAPHPEARWLLPPGALP